MRFRRFGVLLLLFLLTAGAVLPAHSTLGQDQESGDQAVELLMQADFAADELPKSPSYVRLLRINLDPGAGSPLHTHPGPEIGLIENGTLTAEVKGVTIVSQPGAVSEPAPPAEAPLNAEFELETGDQIFYLSQTPMTFQNNGSEVTSILTAVVLPAGHQHPPGITYLEGDPQSTDFEGVVPEILGDGIATNLPTGPSQLLVERVRLAPGEPIPASQDNVLYSIESGPLDFVVIGGKVQVSRVADPGPQADSAPGAQISMSQGDALFFPLGNEEVNREDQTSELVLLRLTITATGDNPATPSPDGSGQIQIVDLSKLETPEAATPESDATPAATVTAAASPTATATPDVTYPVDAIVQVIDEGVRLRDQPSTEGEIVLTLEFGQLLQVLGAPEQGDDITWWPVALVDDPSITGYVADDFIGEAESQQEA